MFFFKKNKPLLKDLLPTDYTDIHSHLLPGIDDGSKDFTHTQSLLSGLSALGFSWFITTPHIMHSVWDNTAEKIQSNLKNTLALLGKEGPQLPIKAAAEYMLDGFFFESLKNGTPLLTLGPPYVLVEMSYLNAPLQLYDCLFELQLAGYKPILAHPERYLFYNRNLQEFDKLKKAGCAFQMNLLSAVGYYGGEVARLAQQLIDREMYDFVGSDVHHEKHLNALSDQIVLKGYNNLVQAAENNNLFRF